MIPIVIFISVATQLCAPGEYNEDEQICLATAEDLSERDFRFIQAMVHGKKRYFQISKLPIKDTQNRSVWLRPNAASSFMALIDAAKANGFNVEVNSSFRTFKKQYQLWREMPDIAGNPWKTGEHSHQTGNAIDLAGTYRHIIFKEVNQKYLSRRWCRRHGTGFRCPTKFFWWLKKNAPKYGFAHNVPGEPWHIAYKGIYASSKLVRSNKFWRRLK